MREVVIGFNRYLIIATLDQIQRQDIDFYALVLNLGLLVFVVTSHIHPVTLIEPDAYSIAQGEIQ